MQMRGIMKTNAKEVILRISKKSKLSIFDIMRLDNILINLPIDNYYLVKLFIDNYYCIESLSDDFYKLFLYTIHSPKYKELFDIVLDRNIYHLIDFLKNEDIKTANYDFISPKDYLSLPMKQIKFIIELLKSIDLVNDDLPIKSVVATDYNYRLRRRAVNTNEEYEMIAIKMYLSIGIDNAIELLCEKYGKVDYDIIYYLFSNLNVKGKKDNISVFRDFLFSNKKDPYNNCKLMLNGSFKELFINFAYFYNSIDYFVAKLGTKLNKEKVKILLNERYLSVKIENPELSGDILDDMLSSYYNRYGIDDSEDEIISKNMQAYNLKLKEKTKSSIKQVNIPIINDYIFELIPLSDFRNLVMGYRAGNCFRINGNALMLFNNFLTNPHMRLLSISTKEYKDFGMVLLMRNGNVLIAQGIEKSNRVPNYITGEKLYKAVSLAIKYIMDEHNQIGDEIVASIIGLSNDNTKPYNYNLLPFIINPLIDDNHNSYNGIDNYQALLHLKDNKTINDIKLFIPNRFYSDNLTQVYYRDKSTDHNSFEYRQIEKILISLRYYRFKETSIEELIYYYSELAAKRELYTICTYHWFIMVFSDGTIDTYINTNNEEIIKEYNLELEKVKEKGPINKLK